MTILRPCQRILNIPGYGMIVTSGRATLHAGHTAGNGLLNGLVAYYPMNEASGNILDAHTAAKTVAAQTTIGNQTGHVYATAREFVNSEMDWALRDDPMNLNALTIGFWAYVYTLSGIPGEYRSIVGNAPVGNYSPGWQLFFNHEGQLIVSIAAGGMNWLLWHAPYYISENAWTSILVTHNPVADTVSINANGSISSTEWTNGIGDGYQFAIGRMSSISDSGYFDGRIGPLAIWNRALSTTEQDAWYAAGAGLAYGDFTT